MGNANSTPYREAGLRYLQRIPEDSTSSSNPADSNNTSNATPSVKPASRPFFIRWTGYRLCNAVITLGIVIPKGIQGIQGHNLTASVLDTILGVLGVL